VDAAGHKSRSRRIFDALLPALNEKDCQPLSRLLPHLRVPIISFFALGEIALI